MQQLTEQQVRIWIESIFGTEGPEDGEHSVSPAARFTTRALVGVAYVPAYTIFENLKSHPELRKFRAFLDEVVRVMEDHGVRPGTAAGEEKVSP